MGGSSSARGLAIALALGCLWSSDALAQPAPAPGAGEPAPSGSADASAPAATGSAAPSGVAPAPYGGARPPEEVELPARTDLQPGQKRPPQDYDGRADVTSVGEDALWIPRVLFFPVYLVTEYLVRVPLGALTVAVEENDVIGSLQKFLTFGPHNNIGLVPTGFIEFGFRPSVGLYFHWDDFLVDGNDLRANFGFGGIRYFKFGAADRIPISTPTGTERARSYFQVEADFLTRADLLFWGVGPDTLDTDKSGYGLETYGGGGRIHVEPWRGTFFEGWVVGRTSSTFEGECDAITNVEEDFTITRICSTPTVRRKILDGGVVPTSYGRPYSTVKSGMRAVLDSRPKRPAPGSGVALDVTAEHAADVDTPHVGAWINWGGSVAGFIDLTGTQRVLSLTVTARFQDIVQDGYEIPFTELYGMKRNEDVPDGELMKGFKPGRLVGQSGVAATLGYHWPIWAFLDGMMEAAVGNVFAGSHLDEFEFEKLRFSFIGGIRSPNHRDHSFNLLVGVGTETFEEGATPNGVRFLFGGTTGF